MLPFHCCRSVNPAVALQSEGHLWFWLPSQFERLSGCESPRLLLFHRMTSLCRNPPANQKPAERKTAGLIAAVASPASLYFWGCSHQWQLCPAVPLLQRYCFPMHSHSVYWGQLHEKRQLLRAFPLKFPVY